MFSFPFAPGVYSFQPHPNPVDCSHFPREPGAELRLLPLTAGITLNHLRTSLPILTDPELFFDRNCIRTVLPHCLQQAIQKMQ